jgi:hypothetical protein
MVGGWRKLKNDELHNLYCSPDIIKMMKMTWAGRVARRGESRNAYRFLVGKPEDRVLVNMVMNLRVP